MLHFQPILEVKGAPCKKLNSSDRSVRKLEKLLFLYYLVQFNLLEISFNKILNPILTCTEKSMQEVSIIQPITQESVNKAADLLREGKTHGEVKQATGLILEVVFAISTLKVVDLEKLKLIKSGMKADKIQQLVQ